MVTRFSSCRNLSWSFARTVHPSRSACCPSPLVGTVARRGFYSRRRPSNADVGIKRLRSSVQDGVGPIDIEFGQTHVWWLYVKQVEGRNALLRTYESLLSEKELQYVQQADSKEVKLQRLLARVLVRTTLCKYLPQTVHPRDLVFATNGFGKPALVCADDLAPYSNLQFSLSHTTSLLGIAVSCGTTVGLDVEKYSRLIKASPLKLAKRRFSAAEYEYLQGLPDASSRSQRFVMLWTLKEAYVKALGTGINAPPGLKGFSIEFQPNHTHSSSSLSCSSSSSSHSCDASCAPASSSWLPATTVTPPVDQLVYRFHPPVDQHDEVRALLLLPDEAHVAALCTITPTSQRADAYDSTVQYNKGDDVIAKAVRYHGGDNGATPSSTQSGATSADCGAGQSWGIVWRETLPLVYDHVRHPGGTILATTAAA